MIENALSNKSSGHIVSFIFNLSCVLQARYLVHKTAICACITSSETAPADKIAALTVGLLEHMSPLSTTGDDGDVDGQDTEAAEGQIDIEGDDAAAPT